LASLSTSIAGLRLRHPVMNASGILGSEPEHIDILVGLGVSAVVTKTFTYERREGYPPPIIVELPSGGLLNAVGLANPGIEGVEPVVRRCKELGVPVIVSVGGRNEDEFAAVAARAEESGADAVELNLSCPHTKGYGIEIGSDPNNVYSVVRAVASTVRIPVIAKLGLSDNMLRSAEKVLEAGAKGLTLINTVKAMAIDVYTLKPVLSNVFGGLSGPPIHPIAVRAVYEVYRELRAEIIGCGGVSDWASAAEMIIAGARAVQVGTILVRNRNSVKEILEGLEEWLRLHEFRSIEEAIGAAHRA